MNQCDKDCSVENPLEQVRLLYTKLAQHPEFKMLLHSRGIAWEGLWDTIFLSDFSKVHVGRAIYKSCLMKKKSPEKRGRGIPSLLLRGIPPFKRVILWRTHGALADK